MNKFLGQRRIKWWIFLLPPNGISCYESIETMLILQVIQAVTFVSPNVGGHLTFEGVTSPPQKGHKELPGCELFEHFFVEGIL